MENDARTTSKTQPLAVAINPKGTEQHNVPTTSSAINGNGNIKKDSSLHTLDSTDSSSHDIQTSPENTPQTTPNVHELHHDSNVNEKALSPSSSSEFQELVQ